MLSMLLHDMRGKIDAQFKNSLTHTVLALGESPMVHMALVRKAIPQSEKYIYQVYYQDLGGLGQALEVTGSEAFFGIVTAPLYDTIQVTESTSEIYRTLKDSLAEGKVFDLEGREVELGEYMSIREQTIQFFLDKIGFFQGSFRHRYFLTGVMPEEVVDTINREMEFHGVWQEKVYLCGLTQLSVGNSNGTLYMLQYSPDFCVVQGVDIDVYGEVIEDLQNKI